MNSQQLCTRVTDAHYLVSCGGLKENKISSVIYALSVCIFEKNSLECDNF